MKKILIALTIIIFLGCTSSQINEKKEFELEEVVVKENNEVIEEEFNFRKSNWGMSSKEIVRLEINKDFVEVNGGKNIALYDEILGYNFLVIYKFYNDKLIEGVYSLIDNEDRFYELKKSLELKYGKAKEEIKDIKALWKTNETLIHLYRKRNNRAIGINYTSLEYIEKMKNKELKEEKKRKDAEENIEKNSDEVREKF